MSSGAGWSRHKTTLGRSHADNTLPRRRGPHHPGQRLQQGRTGARQPWRLSPGGARATRPSCGGGTTRQGRRSETTTAKPHARAGPGSTHRRATVPGRYRWGCRWKVRGRASEARLLSQGGRHTTTLRRLASRSGRLPAALRSTTHLLHAAGGRRALASSLGGQLLAGRLAAGALAARGRHGRVSTRALCAQLLGARSRTGPSAWCAPWLRRSGDE